MEVQRLLILSLLLIVSCALEHTESGLIKCREGEFYVTKEDLCQKCSTCNVNEIIRKPCSSHKDTQCGPFKEFEFMQSSEDEQVHVKKNKTHQHHKKHHHDSSISSTTHASPTSNNRILDFTSVSSSEEQWRTLAMGLIGVLCVVSVFLAFFVFAVCYIKYKRPIVEKDIVYDPEYLSTPAPSETYIQVKPIFSSRDPLKNCHSGYDSGSDDGYPCTVQVASATRLIPPMYIPPVGDEYDADHSGSSTLKSDYVYFNCPQNGNQNP
ncbi:hypothetical protein LOTGIDRAFT_159467 [Lottia gigantea]|uniref:TNFR-Cys domain-containing protein n=1 Tax=Lottia gigantea TaxID=225164 RepID=V4ARI4_LOTGI|nr:hypothetical protein LOTGIDRAFT_159467 [Lottia gigantea]ESO97435.1 hypothetical protein LOTGIDRAFT_159467 [Lottia gigantea]